MDRKQKIIWAVITTAATIITGCQQPDKVDKPGTA